MKDQGFTVKQGEPWYEDCISDLLKELRREEMYKGYTHFRIAEEFHELSTLLHELDRQLDKELSEDGARGSAKRKMGEMASAQEVEQNEGSRRKRIRGTEISAVEDRRKRPSHKATGGKHPQFPVDEVR